MLIFNHIKERRIIQIGYYTFQIPKGSGGVRTITAPDDALKAVQRKSLRRLERDNWISSKAHGFKKRANCLTNAKVHAGKKYILNIDIKDFFGSITSSAYELFVAQENAEIRRLAREGGNNGRILYNVVELFHAGALPQGAPTSPFMSNLYMRRFDTQIQALLRQYISDDILYTRYADDMTFSSNSRAVERVLPIVRGKLGAMRLAINDEKTKFMSRSQRQEVTGININSGRPTIGKAYRRKVRAIVHRAGQGWAITSEQKNRLLGMISHISLCHPEEAKKYREALLPITTTPEGNRKFTGVKRIKLPVKHKRIKKKDKTGKADNKTRTVNRKIKKGKKRAEIQNTDKQG